jgi:CheY-like chemotaxis protein
VSTVLIVEDELIVALDLEGIVEDAGYKPDGPYVSVAESIEALERGLPQCAILDVRLTDGEVFPVADRLNEAGIPIIFHSGHANDDDLLARYPMAQICHKPASSRRLVGALAHALTQ